MKKIIFFILMSAYFTLNAQQEYKYIRQGNKAYKKNDFNKAEALYSKALHENEHSLIAQYNFATTLFKENNLKNSIDNFIKIIESTYNKDTLAIIHYNLGNAYAQYAQSMPDTAKEKINYYKKSADAFRKALNYNPTDKEAKFNYLIINQIIKDLQKKGGGGGQNQNKNQNKKQNQNKDQNKDQKQQDNNKQQQQQQNKNQQQNSSPEQRKNNERILKYIDSKDREANKKVKLYKQQHTKRVIKNW